MPSKFKTFHDYLDVGLSPIPLLEGKKRPVELSWQDWCSKTPPASVVKDWEKRHNLDHIGLALGTEIKQEQYLVAIDVDDDNLQDVVWAALGEPNAPAKRGKKGVTIFCLANGNVINQKIKRRKADGKPERLPSVEILCHGSQTVVPPSVHPETEVPYYWTTRSILDGFPENLPSIDEWTIDEIVAVCQNRGEKITALNEMTWLGLDKGGNTHDSSVEAAAWMVSRGWPDQKIHARIERAKKEACERNGDQYSWPNSTRTIQEWIDSARAKGMTDSSKKVKKRPPERVMSEWAIDELGGVDQVVNVKGTLRHYKDGHWPEVNIPWLKRAMFQENPNLRKSDVENAVHIIHTLTDTEHFGYTAGIEARHDPKRGRICLRNGTLNIRTGELEKHDKDHELCFQLDISWDDTADCPLYNSFCAETFGGDDKVVNMVNEYAGLTLVDDMSFQKFLVLKGPGGNGKGTWARVLRSMHDPAAVGSVSITDLDNERKRTSLAGKLLNISGEQSRLNLVSDTYLKKITGQDPVDIRILYGETQNNVLLSTRFLEMVNEMPQTSDNSDALKRRMLIALTPNRVSKPDPELANKLYQERAGILRLWVESLKRLQDRGRFDEPESSENAVDEYMLSNNPVEMWVRERTEKTDGKEGQETSDLYGDFKDWAQLNGYTKPFTSVFWGNKLTALGYPSKVIRVGNQAVRIRNMKIKRGMSVAL